MGFLAPMLASPIPKKNWVFRPNEWAAEEKIDGIRIIIEIEDGSTNLFAEKKITSWSRYGILHPLPTHILEDLCKLPNGIYDAEKYVPGKRSYGAVEIENQPDLILCIFDVIHFTDGMTIKTNEGIQASRIPAFHSYDLRRSLLEDTIKDTTAVQLIVSSNVNTWEEVVALRDAVWARDGEGLILKRRSAPYQIGKRSKDFIKIKDLKSAVLTVIGFQPSKGLINDRGPYGTVILRDDEGNTITVKTRTDALCRAFEEQAEKHDRYLTSVGMGIDDRDNDVARHHPAIGRKLRIEYQERTMDGSYRHPRWDRWENE